MLIELQHRKKALMIRPIFLAAILAASTLAAETPQAPTVDSSGIPLKDVWALDMPGTRDVRELEKDLWKQSFSQSFLEESLSIKVQRILTKRLKPDEQAPPAFLVERTGLSALRQVVEQLELYEKDPRGKRPAVAEVPAHKELSLVFFSYARGRYVELDRVLKSENRIRIDYHYVAHQSTDVTSHFAIIPVGKLEAGTGKVLIERLPPVHQDGERVTVLNDGHKSVCSSFTFEVKEDVDRD
ncbi:hypothetical protein [Aeoliella sp. SH292]|uniref:hypothetical protein n=1 Tax=Aeoliella sp. SH292 TaxID=3454464 RepID=UPI003F9A005F